MARAARAVKPLGWRLAQIQASVRAMDVENVKTHWRWLFGVWAYKWWRFDDAWDLSVPWSVPEGCPIGSINENDYREWHPETTLWRSRRPPCTSFASAWAGRPRRCCTTT